MNTAEGVVETIRTGRGVSVSISGAWYGAGFDVNKLPFKEGNTIKFVYTEKGIYKNMDLNSVEVTDASEKAHCNQNHKKRKQLALSQLSFLEMATGLRKKRKISFVLKKLDMKPV